MNSKEWLEWYEGIQEFPENDDAWYINIIEKAQVVISEQSSELDRLREENERLERKKINLAYRTADYPFHQNPCRIIDYGYSDNILIVGCQEIEEKLQAAETRAAQHLADQDLLVARERQRVAEECAEIAEGHQPQEFTDGCGTGKFIARTIRARFGLEEEK